MTIFFFAFFKNTKIVQLFEVRWSSNSLIFPLAARLWLLLSKSTSSSVMMVTCGTVVKKKQKPVAVQFYPGCTIRYFRGDWWM
jgi:hypothetical protein